MTPKNLKDFILWKLINPTNFSDSDMLIIVNVKMDEICDKVTEANQGFFGVYADCNLVASTTASLREYPLPNDILNNLYKLELKLDGTNWIPADRVNLIPGKDFRLDESWIRDNYNNSKPKYAIFRNSLFILSGEIEAVVEGCRLWYINYPDPIPNLTETVTDLSVATDPASEIKVGFPKQFHELLARAVIIDYKGKYGLSLTDREPLFDQDLNEKIKRLLGQDLNEIITASYPNEDDGSDL